MINDALEKIKGIRGYTYTRIDDETKRKEVEKVLPEVVTENENGTKAVCYGHMVALLVEGMHQLVDRMDRLEHLIATHR